MRIVATAADRLDLHVSERVDAKLVVRTHDHERRAANALELRARCRGADDHQAIDAMRMFDRRIEGEVSTTGVSEPRGALDRVLVQQREQLRDRAAEVRLAIDAPELGQIRHQRVGVERTSPCGPFMGVPAEPVDHE